ncbi:MAG: electron transfer flavoprotein subunit beta/FixA family protein [Anaerolineales bacterium]|nr:electron transfer flavoprotein subunit beta/FixA family protein [Anaerolineales bacterium]MDW8161856.1 electron transfer flavoprotein subunit beta/FixA family protein [Anaerolineales bacterium]
MNIVVCVKQVPDTAAKLQVVDSHVTWGDSPLIVNPWDEYAYEEALLLKEKHGGRAVAITMGPESAIEALKTCLAVGCDEAYLITDPVLKGSDAPATALTLAKAIQKLGEVDLVLLGKQAIDGDTGLTPAMLGRHLGWTVLTQVIKIQDLDPAARTIRVERLLEEGRQVCTARLPAVVSVIKGINEPRYPSFMGIRKASKATIPTWGVNDLGVDPGRVGAAGAFVAWPEIYMMPVKETKVEWIEGSTPQEIAAKLADKLIAEKVI